MSAASSKEILNSAGIESDAPLFDFGRWLAEWQNDYLVLRTDAEGRVVFVGPSVREILGFEPSDLIGRSYREFFDIQHPLHLQLRDLSDHLNPGQRGARRCVARRVDKRLAFFSVRERMLADEQGRPTGREILAQDDTVHINAELSLRQSERKYRRLVDGLRGDYIIYSHDSQGLITYISPSVRQVLGHEPGEFLGKNWREFVEEDFLGRDDAERVTKETLAGKHFHRFVVEVRHADGGARFLDIQERPTLGVNGAFVSMEGIAKDVTEEKRRDRQLVQFNDELERRVAERTAELSKANDRLIASEARYRDVVENQSEFIVRWLPDGTRTFVNDAYCRYFGAPRSELIGRAFFPLILEEDREISRQALSQLSPESPVSTIEHRVYRADGSIGWTQWTDRAFFDAEGRVVEYQSVGRDVTELRESADLLREKEAHLTHVSRLATLGELVAGIAHEVHQPLHAAKTFGEAARRNLEAGRPDAVPTAIQCIREMSAAITRTAEIIRRLRDYTRARPVEMRDFNVNDAVHEAADIMSLQARRAGIRFKLDLASDLPDVQGDQIQIQQVCVNFIKNAIEATEEDGEVKSTVVIRTASHARRVNLSVSDQGRGLGDADESKLFDAFYTTKSGGMGMGLSLCQRIAESHGGEVSWSKYADGCGVTFTLTLPIIESPRP